MDNLPCTLGYVGCMVLFVQITDFLCPTENQAFKAAVSTFVILSQIYADLFILFQASAASLNQEDLHFHF